MGGVLLAPGAFRDRLLHVISMVLSHRTVGVCAPYCVVVVALYWAGNPDRSSLSDQSIPAVKSARRGSVVQSVAQSLAKGRRMKEVV